VARVTRSSYLFKLDSTEHILPFITAPQLIMSGRLIIATKKSYNPWSEKARDKVAKDEANAASSQKLAETTAATTSLDSALSRIRKKNNPAAVTTFELFPELDAKAEESKAATLLPAVPVPARTSKINKDGTPTVGDFALVTLPTSDASNKPGFYVPEGREERELERRRRDDPMGLFIKSAEVPPPSGGQQHGQVWICPDCGFDNRKTRHECMKCQHPKPAPPAPPPHAALESSKGKKEKKGKKRKRDAGADLLEARAAAEKRRLKEATKRRALEDLHRRHRTAGHG